MGNRYHDPRKIVDRIYPPRKNYVYIWQVPHSYLPGFRFEQRFCKGKAPCLPPPRRNQEAGSSWWVIVHQPATSIVTQLKSSSL